MTENLIILNTILPFHAMSVFFCFAVSSTHQCALRYQVYAFTADSVGSLYELSLQTRCIAIQNDALLSVHFHLEKSIGLCIENNE